MVRLLPLLFALGCAMPASESVRPRGVDVYVEKGRADYGPGAEFDDWRVGVNVHFDVTYDDERGDETK